MSSSITPLSHSSTAGSLSSSHNRQRSTGTTIDQQQQRTPRSMLVDSTSTAVTTSTVALMLPHAPISEQISQVFRSDDTHAAGGGERIWLISAFDVHSSVLVDGWRKSMTRLLIATSLADVRCVLSAIVARIQRL